MKIMALTKLKQIESGRQYVKPGDAYELGRIYGADDAELERLRELAVATGEPGWWQEYTGGLVKGFDTFFDLETSAARLSVYHPAVVYGLLQTEDYAMAVDTVTTDPALGPRAVAHSVRLRTQRLPKLIQRNPVPRIDVVLGEAALRLRVGDESVMAAQRDHLLDVNRLESVSISVLLPDAGPHLGLLGSFILLDFDDDDDPSVSFVESYGGARYDDRAEPVSRHRTVFESISALTVPVEEYFR